MAFDEGLAARVRDAVQRAPGVTEKRMFGGLAFMSPDYMFVGILGDVLMARVGPARHEEALARAHVRPMDFTGKPMRGYVYVDPAGIASDAALEGWVDECLAFVRTLPPKQTDKGSRT